MKVEVLVEDAEGHGRDVGAPTPVTNRRMRRALHRRDKGACRFPGCGQSTWLHAHHINPREHGGPAVLDNFVLLRGFHHRLVHEGGWTVALVDDAVVWADPHGVPVTVEPLAGSAQELVDLGRKAGVEPNGLRSRTHNDRLDWGYAVSVVADHCRRPRRRAAESTSPQGRQVLDST